MCGHVVRQLRIGLVVYGKETPVIGAVSSIHSILTDPPRRLATGAGGGRPGCCVRSASG